MENIKKIESLEKYKEDSLSEANEVLHNSSIYTGIIYRNSALKTFYERLHNRKDTISELVDEVKAVDINNLLKYFE